VETQHYALFNGQYERLFRNDSPWSLFAKTILQYDEFRPFDLRLTVNGGVGYRFIKTDHLLLKGRLGAGASREFGGISDEWVPEAVFGADYEHQLTKKQKLVLNVDYFPAWGDFNDYRLLTVFAWEVVLDEEANLHFKLAINDQYDSTPDGSVPNDLNYSMMLLWKL
jgi:putative salt-induced outer membrane protein YdiY